MARLQRRGPAAVVAEILNVALRAAAWQAERSQALPPVGALAGPTAVVHAWLADGLDRAARAAGRAAGTSGAAVLAKCLPGASTSPLGDPLRVCTAAS